ncbi:hypothetical protein [Sphingomonas sp.]|uniref:hypothetical protein n=1 Tax=Sphingomonas sp. TaxID=28214 RepID=UPI003CC571BC
MNDVHPLPMLLTVAMQWSIAAAAIWLTWWAAQSRDTPTLRVIAMTLVVVPALGWPLLTAWMTTGAYETISRRAFVFGAANVAIGIVRALFLAGWAALSRDRTYLRAGAAVIAGGQLLLLAGQAIVAVAQWL